MPHDAIHYPRAYFAAAVLFAMRIAQLTGMPLPDALLQYTGLYREVTGRNGLEGGIAPLWDAVMAKIAALTGAAAITQTLYDAYLQQPHSRYQPQANTLDAIVFGALGYVYDAATRQVRMHFFPTRGETSALASHQVAARRADFRALLQDIQVRHPDAESVKSSTWLQNLPNYRNLFPPQFQACLTNTGGSTFIGIWGQFVKGDGSGNEARLAQFQAQLAHAQSVDEAIAAFPFPVLEAVGPIHEFYQEYGLMGDGDVAHHPTPAPPKTPPDSVQ